ncbi:MULTISPECIES: amino acid ABC transporter ATP-binding protein [Pseudomonas]|uniref:amino acid ABC transporter ATP-binding protein n=1 Tax=Pseudomonas TaxID=286 RepID=UPI000B4EF720|nr:MULTISPECIES: amino acid ABC transporter ATP-binding protein [Pseudomonas]MBB3271373.1 polar amino acid transport system ATP-binding protein [Pseudomonas sp. OG7]MCE5988785.1 amino acid ABC transporter ATP-binding protein [Pseudomonas sp. LM20]POA89316.1 glutamine ABC transporter ATP-binding protein [Pseudomonas sp. FW305-E2]PYB93669.1 amino acid ABC transporter ATP-binding protein [Pseudomonas fulva]PYC16495.1 amino acid ABC transporter ATP-binding protein [Pseudomonas fulva]
MTKVAQIKDVGRRENVSPILTVEGLGKSFGSVRVLNNVDFSMASGEVVAIIGPSGSGKSTFLRCINQLEPPTEGTICIGGQTIDASKGATKQQLAFLNRKLGMVFQSFNLFPHLTVLENVSLAQRRVLKRSAKEADERSMQLLTRVGLASKANMYPSRCSGGQQQRIAISRALALDPEVMLFDEPTSALDPEVGLEVLAVMRELANEGMTMIVVTHEMRFAENVSDRVVVMADGGIIEQGRSADVMRNPQHPRVQQFLTAVRDR